MVNLTWSSCQFGDFTDTSLSGSLVFLFGMGRKAHRNYTTLKRVVTTFWACGQLPETSGEEAYMTHLSNTPVQVILCVC